MPLMLKRKSVPGTLDFDPIRFVHQSLERLHAGLQFAVIEGADVEIEIFESLRAHPRQLRHRGRRPSQHDPFCFLHSLVVTGRIFFATSFICSGGTSDNSVMLLLPRMAI